MLAAGCFFSFSILSLLIKNMVTCVFGAHTHTTTTDSPFQQQIIPSVSAMRDKLHMSPQLMAPPSAFSDDSAESNFLKFFLLSHEDKLHFCVDSYMDVLRESVWWPPLFQKKSEAKKRNSYSKGRK